MRCKYVACSSLFNRRSSYRSRPTSEVALSFTVLSLFKHSLLCAVAINRRRLRALQHLLQCRIQKARQRGNSMSGRHLAYFANLQISVLEHKVNATLLSFRGRLLDFFRRRAQTPNHEVQLMYSWR